MNITILTTGTRGDTQPYLALGLALKQAGHSIRISAFENFEALVKAYQLDFFPIHGNVAQVASRLGQGGQSVDNPLKFLLSFNQLKDLVTNLQEDFFTACVGADAVIYHTGAAVGYFAAQQMKIPAILASPYPFTPTRDYPSLIFYHLPRLGKTYNYLTHKIQEQIFWFASSSAIRGFWKKEFGRLPEDFGCPYPRQVTRRQPTVISYSNHVFPRPANWPEHVHTAGYWFLDEEPGWQPPAELLNFLRAGKPPVYVGFGSVGDPTRAEQTTRLVIEALKRSGQRGVLATGWNALTRVEDPSDDIFFLDSAPHSWLLPQMAAAVHHGGAGTTAAGLRAGVPSVIVPFGNDQFAWGLRVYELGVGARPIPQKSLTVENLSRAILAALAPEIQSAASEMGTKIRSERGAEKAAQIIDESFH
jgi:sterol 3beta-glucosyltransferase